MLNAKENFKSYSYRLGVQAAIERNYTKVRTDLERVINYLYFSGTFDSFEELKLTVLDPFYEGYRKECDVRGLDNNEC